METPNYIQSLLIPNAKKASARRVWGIELELTWLPFFLATNAMGDSAIPSDALGAPLRLGYEPDGSVKFTKTGRPVTKVVKEIADSVRMVKENFTAGLLLYATGVIHDNPEGYKKQVESARVAGEPIQSRDRANLEKALAEQREEAMAEMVAEAERKGKAEAKELARASKEKERVTA
ncbi:hypothetical protein LCGC14_0262670 [marine sediment metagenome]|uniref:Uncharacterized protein n=1 Tax=marine sediment metagenome TaxID=412755 RepID=A0A0F9X5Y9_9ZZZZ